MCNQLSQVYSSLSAIPYPYEHVEKQVTLAGYALNQIPPPDAVGPVFSTADSMLEASAPNWGAEKWVPVAPVANFPK